MAATPTKLITVAEYVQIPDPPDGHYELYHGELVKVGLPKHPHQRAQYRLPRLLESILGHAGIVDKEIAYCPVPEYECWAADVAFVSKARWGAIDGYLKGAPEIVIEIMSPSNRMSVIADKRDICLENGALEFWIVDTDSPRVDVFTKDGRFASYKPGQEIPLLFGGTLAVDAIFA
jgi:Uma2 family endonuclease